MKMFRIPHKLPGLNDYIKQINSNRNQGNKFKKEIEEEIMWILKSYKIGHLREPVYIKYHWHEPNMKRDLDNIASAKKFIQDAMRKYGCIANDGWKNICGFHDSFFNEEGGEGFVEVFIYEDVEV